MGFGLDDVGDAALGLLGIPDLLGGDRGAVPSLIIEELTGSKRRVELRERALPYRPVSWEVEQRTTTQWYPGSTVATQQVLGPQEAPTIMEGMWKDRFMPGAILVNDSPDEVRTAEQAVRLFYDLCRSGNTLRVQWASEVRGGLLKRFSADYQRLRDVGWRAEFEWSSRDDEVPLRAAEDPAGPSDLRAAQNLLDDILGFDPEDSVQAFTARLVTAVEEVRETVGELFGVLRAVEAAAALPDTVLGAVAAAVESIRAELSEEISRLNEDSHPSTTNTDRVAAGLRVELFRRNAARRAVAVRAEALAVERDVNRRAVPRFTRVVVVREDVSAYTLALQLYGDPDLAGLLIRSNGLDSAVIPAGFRLQVPPRPTTPDGSDSADHAC